MGCRVMYGMVGGWWGFGGVGGCIRLSGISVGYWRFGGVLNSILMEVLMSSVGVPFGSSTGVSLVRQGSR